MPAGTGTGRKGDRGAIQMARSSLRRAAAALRGRLGYRGTFLALLGAYDLFFGTYLLGGRLQHSLVLPQTAWGIVWLVTGSVLIVGGFLPGRWDTPFFALGVLVKAAWAFEYFWLSVHSGIAFDWARGCYFLCLAVIVMMVSSWPEPFSGP